MAEGMLMLTIDYSIKYSLKILYKLQHTNIIRSSKTVQNYKMYSSCQRTSITLFFFFFFISAKASVPASATFKNVNEGDFGEYVVEYQGSYRVLDIFTFPFQLCFYNTTPNAYTLALRMGTVRSESLMRWVWEANRGNPVGENATFSLGTDGNLVLAHADGRIAWQSGTANKGVVGFKLLSNGNMVLHDSNGKFLWQSFDFPTDTLLVGQSLRSVGPTKLVSRASRTRNGDGGYSLELEAQKLVLVSKKSASKSSPLIQVGKGKMIEYVRFNSDRKTNNNALRLDYKIGKSAGKGTLVLSKSGFNTTLTYLRLGIDGSLKGYTYDTSTEAGSWKETFGIPF